jgi:hypothetical protein
MPKIYTIKYGDTLSKIARIHGLSSWKELYYHPSNKVFREKRPNPNLIYPRDQINIPLEEKKSSNLPIFSLKDPRYSLLKNELQLNLTLRRSTVPLLKFSDWLAENQKISPFLMNSLRESLHEKGKSSFISFEEIQKLLEIKIGNSNVSLDLVPLFKSLGEFFIKENHPLVPKLEFKF